METRTKPKTELKPRTETEALFNDLSKPDLANLAYVLRHPDTWPKGFVWDFKKCDHCAMGLARSLWTDLGPNNSGLKESFSHMARGFGMPYEKVKNVFAYGEYVPQKLRTKITKMGWFKPDKVTVDSINDFDKVSPEMVADAIDKYLATKK